MGDLSDREHGPVVGPKSGDAAWLDNATERRIREYVCSRGIPRSVFLGRVVGEATDDWDADPRTWLPEDTAAALAWQEWKDSLCSGCGHPRAETFAEPPPDWAQPAGRWEERYEAHAMQCDACAARDRKAWNEQKTRDTGQPPPAGRYYTVMRDPDVTEPA